jgi:hypothetical protein
MGFEIQENNITFYELSDLEKGMALTAIYTGSTQGGEYNTLTHYFQEDDGAKIGLNGCADLDKRLALVSENTPVKVVYNGMKKIETKHGITNAHNFWIEAANEEGVLKPVLLGNAVAQPVAEASDEDSLRA